MTLSAAQEMRLQVTALHPEAADILSLTLADLGGEVVPDAGPGAHIALRLGKVLVRQYSLRSGSDRRGEVLSEAERQCGDQMTVCVSRCMGTYLSWISNEI